ncbi:glycosyltransferase family 39 protein [Micromonospora mirobrigensis]|uniref:Mannosyltransferase n=1 Tax=Micromonospora mirobrigensis TaxID=262898 RepID=A0A1C4YW45_9ACTN|nr:glycosyltransferase family 39 protein [Micromonospora mirobrigensis]SCF24894.1 mannosyltransferase [Micromonospora mirobrigensis]
MKDAETLVLPPVPAAGVGVEDPWGEDHDPVVPPEADPPRRSVTPWLLPTLLMGALAVTGADRTGPAGGDVANPLHHLLLRAWTTVFGGSDLALRTPSILAVTATAALVAALAARVFTPRVGLLAGLIFALLPATTRYAQQPQPYALAMLAAVLATWCLVRALEAPTARRLAGYGAAVLLLGTCHAPALLLLVGHGWAVVVFRRGLAPRWLLVASLGAAPAVALLLLGAGHGDRLVAGVAPTLDVLAATPGQLFGVTALAGVLAWLALFSLPLRRSAAIYTAWAVAPPLALLLIAQVTPVWLPAVLLFTLPAWATLGAVALARVHAGWCVVVLVAVAVLAAPVQVALRSPDPDQRADGRLTRITRLWTPPGGANAVAPGPRGAGGG